MVRDAEPPQIPPGVGRLVTAMATPFTEDRDLDLDGAQRLADHLLTERLREGRGDRVALRLDDGAVTYDELDVRANRYATALGHLDVRPEERVLLAVADGADFAAALLGGLKAGAVPVMVNPHQPVEARA
jgi:acyl-CoA synthetase (AMP-forming)/AMP-acid ligase II